MSRRGHMGGSVRVYTEVDVNDVLEEIDTKALIEEIKGRAEDKDAGAVAYLNESVRGEHDRENLAYAVDTGNAQEALSILTRIMRPRQRVPGGVPYDQLPLCISTRRPIVL